MSSADPNPRPDISIIDNIKFLPIQSDFKKCARCVSPQIV